MLTETHADIKTLQCPDVLTEMHTNIETYARRRRLIDLSFGEKIVQYSLIDCFRAHQHKEAISTNK